MKNFFLIAIAMFTIVSSVQSQDYGPVEWDIIRLGYVIPSGEGAGSGIALGTEVRYNVNNNISAGLRAEFALFGSGDVEGADVGAAGSYSLIGDYYFQTESNKRAFAGFGIGSFGGVTVTTSDGMGGEIEAEGGGGLGVIPRLGYELGFLRVTGEYNLLFAEGASNYLGVHLAFTIGGRR